MDYKEKVTALLNSQELSKEQKEKLESIFPELKESEDEKIRKGLLNVFTNRDKYLEDSSFGDLKCKDIISWLEKQGDKEENLKEHNICETCDEQAICVNPCPMKLVEEQKPADKVEPIFNVGDKIQYSKGCGIIMTIEKIENGEYVFANNMGHTTIEWGNKWYLVEQKPVEMKSAVESLGISLEEYKKIVDECVYELEEQKPAWSEANLPEFESYLCLMFQKFRTKGMCTNGEIIDYVKEHSQKLKDILVKLAWSEEDERMYRGLHNLIYSTPYCDSRKELSDWLKSLKDRVQPQPKQEWSEEDEKMVGNIRSIIEKYAFSQSAVDVNGDLCEKEYIDADNWLKSLRPQKR